MPNSKSLFSKIPTPRGLRRELGIRLREIRLLRRLLRLSEDVAKQADTKAEEESNDQA